jgi:hypothetical protein
MVLLLAALLPISTWDFSTSDHGFVSTGGTDQWEWGQPTVGPTTTNTVWGTRLSGFYLNDTADYLEVPMSSLVGLSRPVLTFSHWYDVYQDDGCTIQVNDGSGWQTVDPIYGYPDPALGFTSASNFFIDSAIDLSDFGDDPQVRFALTADETHSAAGWYLSAVFLYNGDPAPPLISDSTIPEDTQNLVGPYIIELTAIDDYVDPDVSVVARFNGAPEETFSAVDMGSGLFHAEIPAQAKDTEIEWYGLASDGTSTSRWPETTNSTFRVFLAAPTNLEGPNEDRLIARRVNLTWTPPDSPHTVVGYQLVEQGLEDNPLVVGNAYANVELLPDTSHIFTVAALYDVGTGDFSESLELDVEVPKLEELDPEAGYQGDQLYIYLEGESLYLLDGVTEVEFDAAIEVLDLSVFDVQQAAILVDIDEEVEPGTVSLTISGGRGSFSFDDVFEVLDGADRPGIIEVVPSKITQGKSVDFEVVASEAFAGEITIDAGDDLVLTSEIEVDGDTAVFELSANGTAKAGEHTVVLDDGSRLWTFEVDVQEYQVPPQRFCATSTEHGWTFLILLPLLGCRKRD